MWDLYRNYCIQNEHSVKFIRAILIFLRIHTVCVRIHKQLNKYNGRGKC